MENLHYDCHAERLEKTQINGPQQIADVRIARASEITWVRIARQIRYLVVKLRRLVGEPQWMDDFSAHQRVSTLSNEGGAP